MTATVSKEALGLMMPGTMNDYYRDGPQYLEAPGPSVLALVFAAVAGWFARRSEMAELAELSNAQLADIGITRAEVPRLFDRDFAIRREQERLATMMPPGGIVGL